MKSIPLSTSARPLRLAAALALCVGAWAAPGAHAEGVGGLGMDGSPLTVGLGVGWIHKGYVGVGNKTTVLPLLHYENRWVDIGIPKIDLKLYSTRALSLRLRLRYANDGYKGSDSYFLNGMADRHASFWAGGALVVRNAYFTTKAELLGDASGNSKGTRAKLEFSRRFQVGAVGLTPALSLRWFNGKYVSYYYGVLPDEARPWRPAYDAGATTNVGLGLTADYALTRRSTLLMKLQYVRLGSAIQDSPLVDATSQHGLFVGWAYRY
jgi:outer membrane protein